MGSTTSTGQAPWFLCAYKKHNLTDDAAKAYLKAIGKLEEIVEPKYYLKLSEIYRASKHSSTE
ncbi:hypothetical protein [Rickettsia endosymbiont of Pantilius tunicatus]|uniref:hypothetical protein n=1 Tax=Rickettsia endosymbiont of Pantilius tunicatus TaxID=3066267 RepID=UPI00376EF7C5